MTLFGLVFVAVIVGFLALMAMRVFPCVNEFLTIRRAVNQIMKNGPTTALEIRTAFDRQKDVEYSISTITSKDLDIQQVGNRLRTTFAYNKEVEILDPVYLLLKFEGGASAGSTGP